MRTADVAGAFVAFIAAMLFANAVRTTGAVEVGMYVLAGVAVIPCFGPFIASIRQNGANLLLLLLFGVLGAATAVAFQTQPAADVWLRAKALAATAAWASVYVVVLLAARTPACVTRLVKWIEAVCAVISASVCAGALLHLVGVNFGEIIQQGGAFRAFGPLGDQVGFVIVLPALIALVAGRPLLFGFHLSALLLTGTRGAMLCLIAGVVVHVLFAATRNGSRYRWRPASAMAAVAVAAAIGFSPVAVTLKDRLLSPTMRWEAIEAGIEVVRKNPLLGVGFNGLDANRAAVAEDWTMPEQAANGLSRASNQYVQTAVDGGMAALALLILFVIASMRNAFRVMSWRDATPELFASQLWLVSMFLGNQASLWLLSSTASGFFMFAVAGLAASASVLARRDRIARHSAQFRSPIAV